MMTANLLGNEITCAMNFILAKASKTGFGAVPLIIVIHLSCNARAVSGVHLVILTSITIRYHLLSLLTRTSYHIISSCTKDLRNNIPKVLMVGMSTEKRIQPIFQDKKLEIYKDLVIIKDCYAPGLNKKLRISDIENVWVENLTFLGGKHRLWGTGTFRRWFPFHLGREAKDKALVIRRKSGVIKAIKITLDTEDPIKACGLLSKLIH